MRSLKYIVGILFLVALISCSGPNLDEIKTLVPDNSSVYLQFNNPATFLEKSQLGTEELGLSLLFSGKTINELLESALAQEYLGFSMEMVDLNRPMAIALSPPSTSINNDSSMRILIPSTNPKNLEEIFSNSRKFSAMDWTSSFSESYVILDMGTVTDTGNSQIAFSQLGTDAGEISFYIEGSSTTKLLDSFFNGFGSDLYSESFNSTISNLLKNHSNNLDYLTGTFKFDEKNIESKLFIKPLENSQLQKIIAAMNGSNNPRDYFSHLPQESLANFSTSFNRDAFSKESLDHIQELLMGFYGLSSQSEELQDFAKQNMDLLTGIIYGSMDMTINPDFMAQSLGGFSRFEGSPFDIDGHTIYKIKDEEEAIAVYDQFWSTSISNLTEEEQSSAMIEFKPLNKPELENLEFRAYAAEIQVNLDQFISSRSFLATPSDYTEEIYIGIHDDTLALVFGTLESLETILLGESQQTATLDNSQYLDSIEAEMPSDIDFFINFSLSRYMGIVSESLSQTGFGLSLPTVSPEYPGFVAYGKASDMGMEVTGTILVEEIAAIIRPLIGLIPMLLGTSL